MSGPAYVVVGDAGRRAVSQDGVRYEVFQQLKGQNHHLIRGFFLDGMCVAIGTAKYGSALAVWRTRNGTDWEHQEVDGLGPSGGFVMNGRLFLFVGAGDRGLRSDPRLTWSEDGGKTWAGTINLFCAATDSRVATGPMMKTAAVGPDRVVAIGAYGRRMMSADGLEWQEAEWHPKDPSKRLSLITIAYGNGLWVAGGLHGVRTTSSDGMQWSEPVAGLEGEHINNIFHDGERFVCVALGATYFSADGARWEREANHDAPPLVIRARGRYYGFKWPARMFASEDSIRWEQVAELDDFTAAGICHGELGG